MKRAFDFTFSILLLLLLLPLGILVALAIVLETPGGALFSQRRVGRGGQVFWLRKFRTMRVAPSGLTSQFDVGSVNRVTRVGAILRMTKLDELPQLWNVFYGEMSVVGPRPEVEAWTKVYPEQWEVVHRVRPGITDYASIEFRDEERLLQAAPDPIAYYRNTVLPRKLALAQQYVRHHSMVGDLKIVLRTALAIIFH